MDTDQGQQAGRDDGANENRLRAICLVAIARGGVKPLQIKNRKWLFKSFKNSFVGKEFVDWLMQHYPDQCSERTQAVALGKEMARLELLHHVTRDHDFNDKSLFYQFSSSLTPIVTPRRTGETGESIAGDVKVDPRDIYEEEERLKERASAIQSRSHSRENNRGLSDAQTETTDTELVVDSTQDDAEQESSLLDLGEAVSISEDSTDRASSSQITVDESDLHLKRGRSEESRSGMSGRSRASESSTSTRPDDGPSATEESTPMISVRQSQPPRLEVRAPSVEAIGSMELIESPPGSPGHSPRASPTSSSRRSSQSPSSKGADESRIAVSPKKQRKSDGRRSPLRQLSPLRKAVHRRRKSHEVEIGVRRVDSIDRSLSVGASREVEMPPSILSVSTPRSRTALSPDNIALFQQMVNVETGVKRKDRRKGKKHYTQCSHGTEITDWIVSHTGLSRDAAVQFGQILLSQSLLKCCFQGPYYQKFRDNSWLYSFVDAVPLPNVNAENLFDVSEFTKTLFNDDGVMQGWLQVKGSGLSTKQYWLEIEEVTEILTVYSNNPILGPLKSRIVTTLDLEDCEVEEALDTKSSKFRIKLTQANGKHYKLSVPSLDYSGQFSTMKKWSSAIKASRDFARASRNDTEAAAVRRFFTVGTLEEPAGSPLRSNSTPVASASSTSLESSYTLPPVPSRTSSSSLSMSTPLVPTNVLPPGTKPTEHMKRRFYSENKSRKGQGPQRRDSYSGARLRSTSGSNPLGVASVTEEEIPFWGLSLSTLKDKEISVQEAIGSKLTMIVMLRHFGCMVCRETAHKILKKGEQWEALGLQVIAVGSGNSRWGKIFQKETQFPGTVYCDQTRTLYKALNCVNGVKYMLKPASVNAFQSALVKGYPNYVDEGVGKHSQLGGMYVIHKDLGLVFSHPSKYANDYPLDDVVECVSRLVNENPAQAWTSTFTGPSWEELQSKDLTKNPRHRDSKQFVSGDFNSTQDMFIIDPAYSYELGTDEVYTPPLAILDNFKYYANVLSHYKHTHYIGVHPDRATVIVSIEHKEQWRRVLLWSKNGLKRRLVPAHSYESDQDIVEFAMEKFVGLPSYSYKIKKASSPLLTQKLIELEAKMTSSNYKFGVLRATPSLSDSGKLEEGALYDVADMSPDFIEFLEFLGPKVSLSDHLGFRGGLSKATGKYSHYTEFSGCELMFHVGPMLNVQDASDPSRKRYIGNDIVVIIFKEGPFDKFDPAVMRSQFNHVFVVVEKVLVGGAVHYRVQVGAKPTVPCFPPYLSASPIYKKGSEFREFFLTKLINAERASISGAKVFTGMSQRTLDQYLSEIVSEFV